MTRRFLMLASVALLAGCATRTPTILAPPGSALRELEAVYAATAGREALTLSVSSNGCTVKADFAVYVERKGEAMTLSLGRKRLDICKSVAMGRTDLVFTWAELGLAPQSTIFLLNPLVAWTGPGS